MQPQSGVLWHGRLAAEVEAAGNAEVERWGGSRALLTYGGLLGR